MKKCTMCAEIKETTEFYPSYKGKNGIVLSSRCKPCNKRASADWGRSNKAKRRDAQVKHNYGLSPKEYADLIVAQNNKCAICRKSDNKRLAVDHDHATGQVRGLLCKACNKALGLFRDDTEIIDSAKEYLNANRSLKRHP